jgi:hypothetical protein
VHVRLDGELVASCAAELERPDVAKVLGEHASARGWMVTVGSPATLAGETMLSIVVTGGGVEFLLHLGSIEGTELRSRLHQAARTRDAEAAARAAAEERAVAAERRAAAATAAEQQLVDEVARMRASRFWKLRDAWWRVRAALGRGEP